MDVRLVIRIGHRVNKYPRRKRVLSQTLSYYETYLERSARYRYIQPSEITSFRNYLSNSDAVKNINSRYQRGEFNFTREKFFTLC
jgi:hypothetical protein